MEKRDTELLRDVLSASRQTEMAWNVMKHKYPFLAPMVWYDKNSAVYHCIYYLVQKYNPETIQKALDEYFATRDLRGLHISFTALVQQSKTIKSGSLCVII